MTEPGRLAPLKYHGFLGFAPLPDETQCPVCGYFDVSHNDVQAIMRDRARGDEQVKGRLLAQAQCRCKLIEDKQKSRNALRYQEANLPRHPPHTFETFVLRDGVAEMLEAARAMCEPQNGPRCLVLKGPVGVGKSHMLEAVCRFYLGKGRTARYELVSSLLDRLRSTYSDASTEDVADLLGWYGSRGVLALDDLGMEKPTEWALEKLVAIVDQRLRDRRDLVVATNRSERDMAAYSPRLASRLFGDNASVGDVRVVEVVAPDFRRRDP